MSEKIFSLAVGEGRTVKTTFEKLSVKKLRFYPKNPRISSFLIHVKKELPDAEIEKMMWEKQPEATKGLYQQVKKDGQINEPLTVCDHQVLEGNTRLAVARKLYEETGDSRWDMLPCRVIIDKLSKEQKDYILCNYHIKKKKDWEAYEQACYFSGMQKDDKLTLQQISQATDINVTKIMDYIKTFEKMFKSKADPKEWSLYYETVKMPESKKAMREGHPDLVEKVADKFKQGKINRAEDVRKLKVILKDAPTAAKFLDGEMDIYAAEKRALHRLPAESDPLLKDLSDLMESINNLPQDRMDEIKKDAGKLSVVRNFCGALKKLCKQLKIKM